MLASLPPFVCVSAVISSETCDEIVTTHSVRTSDEADQGRRPANERENWNGSSSKFWWKIVQAQNGEAKGVNSSHFAGRG